MPRRKARRASDITSERDALEYLESQVSQLTAENKTLRAQLLAERQRHQEREERLLDRVLTAAQTRPISDQPRPPAEGRSQLPSELHELTSLQRAECEEWMRAAEETGRSRLEGESRWWRTRFGRVPDRLASVMATDPMIAAQVIADPFADVN